MVRWLAHPLPCGLRELEFFVPCARSVVDMQFPCRRTLMVSGVLHEPCHCEFSNAAVGFGASRIPVRRSMHVSHCVWLCGFTASVGDIRHKLADMFHTRCVRRCRQKHMGVRWIGSECSPAIFIRCCHRGIPQRQCVHCRRMSAHEVGSTQEAVHVFRTLAAMGWAPPSVG